MQNSLKNQKKNKITENKKTLRKNKHRVKKGAISSIM